MGQPSLTCFIKTSGSDPGLCALITASGGDDVSVDVNVSPQDILKRVIAGDRTRRIQKEVEHGSSLESSSFLPVMMKCLELHVAVCKTCILYKKKVSGEERSLGIKNMFDYLKRCLPGDRVKAG